MTAPDAGRGGRARRRACRPKTAEPSAAATAPSTDHTTVSVPVVTPATPVTVVESGSTAGAGVHASARSSSWRRAAPHAASTRPSDDDRDDAMLHAPGYTARPTRFPVQASDAAIACASACVSGPSTRMRDAALGPHEHVTGGVHGRGPDLVVAVEVRDLVMGAGDPVAGLVPTTSSMRPASADRRTWPSPRRRAVPRTRRSGSRDSPASRARRVPPDRP